MPRKFFSRSFAGFDEASSAIRALRSPNNFSFISILRAAPSRAALDWCAGFFERPTIVRASASLLQTDWQTSA
jgi:hypothetical protein